VLPIFAAGASAKLLLRKDRTRPAKPKPEDASARRFLSWFQIAARRYPGFKSLRAGPLSTGKREQPVLEQEAGG